MPSCGPLGHREIWHGEIIVEQNVVKSKDASDGPDGTSSAQKPRIWPLVVIVIVFWAFYAWVGMRDLSISATFMSRAGAEALLLLVFPILWLANRRISWSEKLQVLGVALV